MTVLGCGGHSHRYSSSSPVKETTVRTVAAIDYVFSNAGNSANYVATFKTTDVKTLLTKVVITGLDTVADPTTVSSPDVLAAIDQRPATGKLYAISNA